MGYTLNEVIDTTTTTNGLNPLPNGSVTVNWFGPTANFSGFAGYAGSPPSYDYDGHYPGKGITITGEEEVYSAFLRDGFNFGPGSSGGTNDQPGYLVDVTGLKSLFTNTPFVVELIAAADSMQTLTNAFVVDVTNLVTNSVSYPNTPPITEDEGSEPWVRGHGGGLSTVSGAFNTDHIQIFSNHPLGGGDKSVGFDHAGTICGFIITDKPVISMPPQPVLAVAGDTVLLNPYAIGVPPLSYQWRRNGSAIAGATNASYTIAGVNAGNAGNYDLVVTNLYGSATSRAVQVGDIIAQAPAAGVVADSNPANPERDGTDLGATWMASSNDGTRTRTGVMDFDAAETNGISVEGDTNFDVATGTVMFWMQSAGVDGSTSGNVGASLFCRPEGASGNDFIVYQYEGGTLVFQSPNNGLTPANAFGSVANVSDNKWHLVALTFDQSAAGGATLYIDGVLDTTNANSAPWSWPVGAPLQLGFSTDPMGWYAYNGFLDDVRFYNRQLTGTEIATVYHTEVLVDTNALQMQLNFNAAPGPGSTLTWQESGAVLQSASQVSGPWTDLPGAASPYTIVPGATEKFYRYRYAHTAQSLTSNPYLM